MAALKASADKAEYCASIFVRFKDYMPKASEGNITSVITELFALSRSLQTLRQALNKPSYEPYTEIIIEDQQTVSKSIQHTLRHVEQRLAPLDEMHDRRLGNERRKQDAYRQTWQSLQEYFATEGARITDCDTLTSRLDVYRIFVDDLHNRLTGDSTSRRFKDLQYRMKKLLREQLKTLQEEPVSSRFERLAIESTAIPSFKKQQSWERRRPRRDDDDDFDDEESLDRLDKRLELDERIERLEKQKSNRDNKAEEERIERLEKIARLERERLEQLEKDKLEKLEKQVAAKRAEKSAEKIAEKIERKRRIERRMVAADKKIVRRARQPAIGAFSDSDQEFEYAELVDSEEEFEDLGDPIDWELESEGIPDVFAPPSPMVGKAAYRMQNMSPYAVKGVAGMDYFVTAPEPPRSSSSGTMSPSILDSESGSEITEKHWAATVFGLPRPSTQFRTTGSESGCYGDHMPGINAKLRSDHEDLLKLPFEDGNLMLKVMIREHDRRCRLLIRQERNSRKVLSCQPITGLRILRSKSNLQLCLPEKRDHVVLWTQLSFPTYERLVLFWCTFHALKSQDEGRPISKLEDAVLHGEECLFSAIIIDDSFQHAFHVLRDKDSKGLRLQASVLTGPLKRTPIWTAFITHQIASTTWIRQPEPRKIHLRELTRYVFTEEYEPQVGQRGEGELYFMSPKDAKRFYQVIDDIAASAI